ncbi:hypothetical protein [Phormidesmis sp. 146-33]
MTLSGLNSITVGCLLCIGVMLSGRFIQSQSEAEIQKSKLAEMQRVADEKEIADNAAKNRIAQFNQLLLTNYELDAKKPPKLDWKRSIDPKKKTFIYDKNRLCVGNAENGTFNFISIDTTACNR